MEGVLFKGVIGSIIYLMLTIRVDLAHVINTVSQYLSKAFSIHWMVVNKIKKYLKGRWDLKLYFGSKKIFYKIIIMCIRLKI